MWLNQAIGILLGPFHSSRNTIQLNNYRYPINLIFHIEIDIHTSRLKNWAAWIVKCDRGESYFKGSN